MLGKNTEREREREWNGSKIEWFFCSFFCSFSVKDKNETFSQNNNGTKNMVENQNYNKGMSGACIQLRACIQ